MLIEIDSTVQATQAVLLEGLEAWIRLGLLSNTQVKQLCRESLICKLPTSDDFVALPVEARSTANLAIAPLPSVPVLINDFEEQPSSVSAEGNLRRQNPSVVSQALQSLVTEISVIWLLFLGVFMVVVSSGVLAASQWKNFPPAGQYGILFAYTVAFWIASVWTGRQPRLQLTARMLSVATLLIIPVNFWMMDGLRVWSSASGKATAAIAALTLTALTVILLRPAMEHIRWGNPRLLLFNSIGLSWLHWGWGWEGFPLAATYLGTTGTALLLFYQLERHLWRSPFSTPAESNTPETPPQIASEPLSLSSIAIAFSTLLLIARAVLVAQVPVSQMGLALGICGWLLYWLSHRTLSRSVWMGVGAGLLLLGWLASVGGEPPWQAIAISSLGLWLIIDRLKSHWQLEDLTALFGVGLQTYFLLWFTLPPAWRESLYVVIGKVARQEVQPEQIAGIALFPYVILMLWLANQLRRGQQLTLANHADLLTLILGFMLSGLSLSNDLMRSLNLLLSAIALIVVVRRRPIRSLIYLTHITGLVALLSWIDFLLPQLNPTAWAEILLAGMAAEWFLSISAVNLTWRRSAWHLGWVLGSISYGLLITYRPESEYWGLTWLVAPALLTLLASRPGFFQPRMAAWLSVPALLLQLALLDSLSGWIVSLGSATLLMLFNTQQLQHLTAAVITVGFGLGFASVLAKQILGEINFELGVNLLAIALLGIWLLWSWLTRRSTRLSSLYARATDGWAIALCILNLSFLTLYDLFSSLNEPSWKIILAAALTTAAIGFRIWRQPQNLGFYGAAWSVEVLVAAVIALTGPSVITLAIATLGLGFLTQLLGEVWVWKSNQNYRSSWHMIPLLYGVLGVTFSHQTFTASSGLYTLAAALIGIGVGRRHPRLKPLTYLALIAASTAAYELLIYQLLQGKTGSLADLLVALAGLAALVAVGDRLLSRWLIPYLHLTARELQAVAHGHWALGSGLIGMALFNSLYPFHPLKLLGIGVMLLLAGYALVAGNRRWTVERAGREAGALPLNFSSIEAWTYAGIVEAIAAISSGLYHLIPEPLFWMHWAAAIACGFAFLMQTLPWASWGWSALPWKRSAALLPGFFVLFTFWEIALQGLLIVAAFYAWLGKNSGRLRLSYISLFLLDWAILRFLSSHGELEPIWFSAVMGGSFLYVAQIDPGLRSPTEREKRHLLRILATGLICLTALYQAEVEPEGTALIFALLTLALSIGLILAGLVMRVRAFLYVGTGTFIFRVLRLLWLFINTHPLLLWAVGIVIGLAFIWIAATFEARRNQVATLVQYWMTELEEWE